MKSFLLLLFGCFSTGLAVVVSLNDAHSNRWPELPPTKPIPGNSPLAKCDLDENQVLDITSIELSPNPPVRGANLTISATGLLKEQIEDGAYVTVEVRLGYIKIISATFDLCDQLADNSVDLTCPIIKGSYDLVTIVTIPEQVPPGKYHVTAVAYTVDDEEVTCLTGDVVFPPELRRIKHPKSPKKSSGIRKLYSSLEGSEEVI